MMFFHSSFELPQKARNPLLKPVIAEGRGGVQRVKCLAGGLASLAWVGRKVKEGKGWLVISFCLWWTKPKKNDYRQIHFPFS